MVNFRPFYISENVGSQELLGASPPGPPPGLCPGPAGGFTTWTPTRALPGTRWGLYSTHRPAAGMDNDFRSLVVMAYHAFGMMLGYEILLISYAEVSNYYSNLEWGHLKAHSLLLIGDEGLSG